MGYFGVNMENDFLYKNCVKVDLHGLTKEEARAEIFHTLNSVDNVDGVVFVHGYHGGRTLKDLVRKEIKSDLIEKKVFLSASVTAFKLKKQ